MNGDVLDPFVPAIPRHPSPQDVGGSSGGGGGSGGGGIVFDAALGLPPDDASAVPVTAPTTAGMTAYNEATDEAWFVNKSLAWQAFLAP